jgi:hypothetical protein
LLAAYAAGDRDAIEQNATSLKEWLHRGGRSPQILGRDDVGPDWDRALSPLFWIAIAGTVIFN